MAISDIGIDDDADPGEAKGVRIINWISIVAVLTGLKRYQGIYALSGRFQKPTLQPLP